MTPSPVLNVAIRAARRAGALAMRHFDLRHQLEVREKRDPTDLVSNADTEVQKEILFHLQKAYPKFKIVAEEGDSPDSLPRGECWIVDPIDGTTNFVHGLPHFAITIAMANNGQVLSGLVYNPITDELFAADQGRGAFRNNKRLRVSPTRKLEHALLGTGFPLRQRKLLEPYLASFGLLLGQSREVRRTGSAALDLAYVACGIYDGFWELRLKPWDLAAGCLLIREAGGFVSDFQGGNDYMTKGDVVAGNSYLHPLLLEKLRECGLDRV